MKWINEPQELVTPTLTRCGSQRTCVDFACNSKAKPCKTFSCDTESCFIRID